MAQRLDQGQHQQHGLYAKTRVNLSNPLVQQPGKVAHVARRLSRADPHHLHRGVHPLEHQVQLPRALAMLLQQAARLLHQPHDHGRERLRRAQRLHEVASHGDGFWRQHRPDRLAHPAHCLV